MKGYVKTNYENMLESKNHPCKLLIAKHNHVMESL